VLCAAQRGRIRRLMSAELTLGEAAVGATLATLALLVCAPCASQLACSCCFQASRRRGKPDHEAVPEVPQFSAEWLTAALRRGCPAAMEKGVSRAAALQRVASLQHGQIDVATEDGGEVANGGGLAGGKTMRVSKITYTAEGTGSSGGSGDGVPLPASMIAKWCSDIDVVGGSKDHPDSTYERVFLGWILGLRHAMDKAMILEIRFYNEIAAELVPATGLRLPVVYYTGVDGNADTSCCLYTWRRDSVYCRTEMLMEDLKVSGFEDCGHCILSWKQAIPLSVVETALLALARVHAWGWGGKGLPRTCWTPLMVGSSSAQYLGVVPFFGLTDKLQYFLDLYCDHPQRNFVLEPDIQVRKRLLASLKFPSCSSRACLREIVASHMQPQRRKPLLFLPLSYLQENDTLVFEFSLCLSRACLGKMLFLCKKWTKSAVF
jgi:hypothetical protein